MYPVIEESLPASCSVPTIFYLHICRAQYYLRADCELIAGEGGVKYAVLMLTAQSLF
jgi:hypothetical protein